MALSYGVFTAVTLDGTIIHKSGLMTGGRSTHNNGKKWDEKDLQGAYDPRCTSLSWSLTTSTIQVFTASVTR